MCKRVYILRDILDGKAEKAAEILRDSPGVRLADFLEGRPNVVTMIQARSWQRLAALTSQVLASVEEATEELQMLPAANKC